MSLTWIVGGIFLLIYALIVTEKTHRTIAALLGGLAMILLGVFDQQEAFQAVDWNVIFLLAGMMSIANVLRETGLFQWLAVRAVRLGGGYPFRTLVILAVITAVGSALLDNVTVVVLVVPITLFVASSLQISPIPFLIAEILASNVGGASTLIGDPPNVLIASAAGIDFVSFAANMAPLSVLILVLFLFACRFMFGREIQAGARRPFDLESLRASQLIADPTLLFKSLVVLAGVLVAFLLHGVLHLQPATIALTGAAVLMLWGRQNPDEVLQDVEWSTLFFFIGLFILVEAVVKVGLIQGVANSLVALTGGNLPMTTMLILWVSAVASGVVDNIPYTAAMIPIIESLAHSMPVGPLWWALAAGADFGGNATLVGASANVVVASLAVRSGHPLSFRRFLVYGLITTAIALVVSTLYIWLRYL